MPEKGLKSRVMPPTIAITGANGFIGTSLIRSLSRDYSIKAIPIEIISNKDKLLMELKGVSTLIHLAGVSSVSDCELNPYHSFITNLSLPIFIAEIFFKLNPNGYFIFPSSAQVYLNQTMIPLDEEAPLFPLNIYAKSKLAAEASLLSLLNSNTSARVTILRLFNHSHKDQSKDFFLPSIYKQLISSQGPLAHLKVGNIDVFRDFSAIQDLIDVFKILINDIPSRNSRRYEVYNICSGNSVKLRDLVIKLAKRVGKEVEFNMDEAKIRKLDPKFLVGNASKFKNQFNWISKSSNLDRFLDLFLADL